MTRTSQPQRTAPSGPSKKDGYWLSEHNKPQRRAVHPIRETVESHPVASAVISPTSAPAWRQANSRSPDTLLPGHAGSFSNGDRRRGPSKACQRPS